MKLNRHLVVPLILLVPVSSILSQPTVTKQPTDQSVSLGANVTFGVAASAAVPLSYQWRFNDWDIPGAMAATLAITNISLSNAGDYTVIVTDTTGSVTSKVATLEVDSAFTKITSGAIVTDRGDFQAAGWADFNNDGYEDLFVVNFGTSV